ncbi:TraH family protein [Thermodesulfatator indicus DSM 15286]|uniref:TraH family protein n=1 Tax=Thermodesulfatator indicus (strain DSM 15286 / JCM 11887 / CIR29812) TaxID=667014 RepID=F8ACM1_THEID|nr:conjugal transfer protein TraH [Thermodesulfatator indicus]AEH45796.1 TraH family protein [Thermodesulfatator indicus DSM 15286]
MTLRLKIVFLLFLLLFLKTAAHADWVEDWLNNSVTSYTGPSYIEAGRRGYLSFGSVSTRTLMTTDRLITFTPPSINFGCGGIDIFMGGFSFLDFDYLVDKFQRIISAAPAFAFEYALRSICEQCGTIVDAMNAAQDLLNSLQLNDCQASRWLGYYLASKAGFNPEAQKEKTKTEASKLATLAGTVRSWKDWLDQHLKTVAVPGQLSSTENQELNRDCPSYINDLLNSGSLIHYVYQTRFSTYGQELEAVLRGYLGDVVFYQNNGRWMVNVIPGCGSKNVSNPLEVLITGKTLVNPLKTSPSSPLDITLGTQQCTEYQSFFPNAKPLIDIIKDTLESAYIKTINHQALTPTEMNLMAMLPAPVYNYIKQLYIYDAPTFALTHISDIAAEGFAYTLLTMVYAEAQKAASVINEYLNRCENELSADKSCIICTQGEGLRAYLKAFQTTIIDKIKNARSNWEDVVDKLSSHADLIQVLRETSTEAIRSQLLEYDSPRKGGNQ